MDEEKKSNLKDNPLSADDLNQVSGGLEEQPPICPDPPGHYDVHWEVQYYYDLHLGIYPEEQFLKDDRN